MAVSLDTLLGNQSKAVHQYAQRADVSADAAKASDQFSRYVHEAPEKVNEVVEDAKAEYKDQSKTLDDYRKEVKEKYEDVAAGDEQSTKEKNTSSDSDKVALQEKEASTPSNEVSGDKGESSEVASSTEAPKQPASEVQLKEAKERGVENIFNVALTGSSEENVVETTQGVNAQDVLARGEKIVESRREVGALILDQLETIPTNVEGAAAQAQNKQSIVVQSSANAQVVNVAAVAAEHSEVASAKPASAVNVARQSKQIAEQALQQQAQLQVQSQPEQQTKAQVSADVKPSQNAAVQSQHTQLKSAEQLLVNVESAGKQAQQQQAQNAQSVQPAAVNTQQTPSAHTQLSQQFNQNNHGQQQKAADVAGKKASAVVLNDGASADAEALLNAKPSDANKPESLQYIDHSKFKEYMKFSEIQGQARTHTQQGATKSESVVAQIKFGMAAAAAKGEKHVTIQLYPKELGTVDVHMKISAGKGAEITMVADKADTASMLQREAQSLKEALNDALKNQNTQLNFAFREEGQGQAQQQAQNFMPNMSGKEMMLEGEEAITPLHQMQLSMENGINLVI